MRMLTDHGDPRLTIQVEDEPGAGGANHEYVTSWDGGSQRVSFQNGPIGEVGVNGVTQESLLAIVIDRLRAFQAGPFACRENAIALTNCEQALMWLQNRTAGRKARGVEGFNKA